MAIMRVQSEFNVFLKIVLCPNVSVIIRVYRIQMEDTIDADSAEQKTACKTSAGDERTPNCQLTPPRKKKPVSRFVKEQESTVARFLFVHCQQWIELWCLFVFLYISGFKYTD